MQRKYALLFLCLCPVVLSAGCSSTSVESGEAAGEEVSERITFTDDLDREVSLEKPQRTAALIGSFADLWCDAGGKESLVAAAHDTWTSFDLDLDDSVADLGEIKNPNMEVLLASDPDFILASAKNDNSQEILEQAEAAGIPIAFFDVSSFTDYLRMLEICTRLTGDEQAYEENGLSQQERIEQAVARTDGSQPSVLYVRATGSSVKVKNSDGSVLGEMLADLDTRNIADSDTGLLENLSLEAIVQDDPEYIFIVLQGSDDSQARENLESALLSSPAWSSLSAVQSGNVYYMDSSLYNLKPNARWAEAYEGLADILYGNPDS